MAVNLAGSSHGKPSLPLIVTFGYILLNAATSSIHSLRSAAFVVGGMQSTLIVTLALGSSGAPSADAPPPPESLLLLLQAPSRAIPTASETVANLR